MSPSLINKSPKGSDSGSDGKGGAAKKRTRLIHPNHSRLAGCDSCHARHLRCVRLDPQNPTCEACKHRREACTNLRNGGARYRPRQGRNLDAALAAFGAVEAEPNSAPPVPQHPPPAALRDRSAFAGAILSLSDNSAESRLGLSEESESLMASLMELVLNSSTFCKPVVHWINLQARFEQAGRRFTQCDVMTETLIMATVTFGSLICDHPLVVGAGSPRMEQLRSLGRHANLSLWARRRAPFCQNLFDRLVDQVARSGCFRVASAESVSVLAMLGDLVSHMHGRTSFELARPYWAMAVAHLRTLADSDGDTGDLTGMVNYHLVLMDAVRSAHSGRRPLWTDEDISIISPHAHLAAPTIERVSEALHANDAHAYGLAVLGQWKPVVSVLRNFARDVSIKLARDEPVELEAIQRSVQDAHELFRYSNAIREVVRASGSFAHTPVLSGGPLGSSPAAHAQTLALTAALHLLIIKRHLHTWKQKRAVMRQIGLASPPAEDAVAANRVEDELTGLLAEGATMVGGTLNDRRNVAGLEVVGPLSSFYTVEYSIPKWAALALEIPCAEMGGPAHYPRSLQLRLGQVFVDALKSQAWAWASRQDDATACKARLRRLEAAVKQSQPPPLPSGSVSAPSAPQLGYQTEFGIDQSYLAAMPPSSMDHSQPPWGMTAQSNYQVVPTTAPALDIASLELPRGLVGPMPSCSAEGSHSPWSISPGPTMSGHATPPDGFMGPNVLEVPLGQGGVVGGQNVW